ncbi:MAG TPA: transcriptional repressor [Sphingobium sp.]|nr:transcriptional repressor [Sphingobium sp.]
MAHAAHTHIHVEPSGDRLAEAARAVMIGQGEQWTEMRAAIFDVLAAGDRPTSAYDIADRVSQQRGKRVAPNSVYRILDLFVANNLAKRVESANAFVVNAHPGCRHDCIYLVCRNCGDATHVDDDMLTESVRAVAERNSFAAERPVIEILGRCGKCT